MIRLITIRFSHFCEKARWALDRAGIEYEERMHLPFFAWGPALLGARNRTVPVLVTDDGKGLPDSTDILRWVERRAGGLYPPEHDGEIAALEDEFDQKLGPATRRIAYFLLSRSPELAAELFSTGGPGWQRAIGRAAYPAMVRTIRLALKVDEAGAERSRKVVERVFARVAERLADGRKYLVGDRFSAADLTFAALCQPILFAPAFQKFVVPEARFTPEMRATVDHYRATPAGRFALRLYEQRDFVRGSTGQQLYCLHCGKVAVEQVGMQTLHGSIHTPASDTEINLDFRCAVCDAGYNSDSSTDDQWLICNTPVTRACAHCGKTSQFTSYHGVSRRLHCSACSVAFTV
jgi:glutathione S-transferase